MNRFRIGRAVLFAGLLSATAASVVAGPVPRFERLGAERGLPSSNVTALFQDAEGFLWIGSRSGLSVYDGYSFRSFEHDVSNPASLSDNSIRTVREDRAGRLWIGTNAGGLERLDRATGTFTHFRHVSSDPRSLSHDSVYAILEDRRGRFWVGTQEGLNRFDPAAGTFDRFLTDPALGLPAGTSYVDAIHEDPDGSLWLGTVGGGLVRFEPDSGSVTSWRHDPRDPRSLPDDRVFAIVEDRRGSLWVGTETGLCRFDRATRSCESIPSIRALTTFPYIVTSLALDGNGTLWIGSWTNDLLALDTATGTARTVPRGGPGAGADDDSRVSALLVDRLGIVWAGTWAAGLFRHHPMGAAIELLNPEERGMRRRDVTSIHADGSGSVWIGTWGGGVAVRRPGDPSLRPLPEPDASTSTVLAIERETDGTLWIGTPVRLERVAAQDGRLTSYAYRPDAPEGLGRGYVTALRLGRDGRLWIGTGGGGLHRLRPDGATFDHWLHDPADPASLSDDYVTALLEDRGGTLWVGTRSGGLNALDGTRTRFERFLPSPGDDRSLGHPYVTAILESADGTLWVGTSGGGLHRLERTTGGAPAGFARVREADGLIDDNVTSIAEDDDGSLWVGTRRGLSRYAPRTGTFTNLGASEGLPATQFNSGAVARGPKEIVFGTSGGILIVPRGTPQPEALPAPVVFTEIRSLGGSPSSQRVTWRPGPSEIPYGAVLSVEFAVLDFASRHRYEYRLAGSHERWTDLGPRREITFTDLDPGTYRIEVRGRNAQGIWSGPPAPLVIRVVPPVWLTWWFRWGVAMALVAIVAGALRMRFLALERRHRELQRLHAQRERALEEARASREELLQAYERLRALTRRLDAAKEDERAHIARELHDEMGQALTATKINLQLLEFAADSDDRARRYEDMFGLLDGLIERVRALSLDLRPPLLEELGFAAALRGYLEAQAQRAGIRIEADIDVTRDHLAPEIAIAAFRGVQEGITNVIRHAGAGVACVTVREDGRELHVTIRDDGGGFDVAATLERGARGGHLGLLGMRERIEALGGSAAIQSGRGSGTELRIRLPLSP